jgi:hypothetical protein
VDLGGCELQISVIRKYCMIYNKLVDLLQATRMGLADLCNMRHCQNLSRSIRSMGVVIQNQGHSETTQMQMARLWSGHGVNM